MSDLVTFLRARLGEDEAAAKALLPSLRKGEPYEDDSGIADRDDFPSYPWGAGDGELEFMAGPGHPARVLREVEAKRRIVDAHSIEQVSSMYYVDYSARDFRPVMVEGCRTCIAGCGVDGEPFYAAGPCATLRLLTLPYADHPDYAASWKP
jgi:uncharacterized protein DUF6221